MSISDSVRVAGDDVMWRHWLARGAEADRRLASRAAIIALVIAGAAVVALSYLLR